MCPGIRVVQHLAQISSASSLSGVLQDDISYLCPRKASRKAESQIRTQDGALSISQSSTVMTDSLCGERDIAEGVGFAFCADACRGVQDSRSELMGHMMLTESACSPAEQRTLVCGAGESNSLHLTPECA